ncbi:unnamed protein product [Cylindrotheca closterium]|uniref:Neurotransmitter-gated ion-channel ligand-binding domain-containing protein n=1 Tax=Cylindrotheca closterium TaxID=2856 RepID=A0AAD2FIF4_9STRA|nr:unnamed protein product [Cylindrotheca closterium]
MERSFKKENRPMLIKCIAPSIAILFIGVFGLCHQNAPTTPIKAGPIPEHLRNLGSSSPSEYADDEQPKRAGACSNVDYANQTYLAEVDPHSLPLNELLIHLDHPAYVSPPNPDGPTIVDIGLYIHNIFNLDPGLSTFDMEGYLDLIWCDPHTKFDGEEAGKARHIYLERDAEKELEAIWWPAITFKNEKGKRVTENQEVIIESDGTVEYREKFKVTLTSKYEMERFPFDKQILRAEVESFAWNSNQMLFHIEEDLVGFSEDFEIPEQTMTHIEEHLETVMEARDRHPFSELVTEIHVYRNPAFYVTKVCIPLGLIVAISWAVFWMGPTDLADRMAISFTGVLTSAAYQFVVTDVVPRHVNNTFLANFVLVTFVMQILTAVENVAVRTLHIQGHPLAAKMVDRVCRVVVPLFFLVVCNIMVTANVLHGDQLTSGGVIGISVGLPILLILISWYMVRRFKARHPEYHSGKVVGPNSSMEIESNTTSQHYADVESADEKEVKGNEDIWENPTPLTAPRNA